MLSKAASNNNNKTRNVCDCYFYFACVFLDKSTSIRCLPFHEKKVWKGKYTCGFRVAILLPNMSFESKFTFPFKSLMLEISFDTLLLNVFFWDSIPSRWFTSAIIPVFFLLSKTTQWDVDLPSCTGKNVRSFTERVINRF